MSSSKSFPGFDNIYRLRGPATDVPFHASFELPKNKDYVSLFRGEWVPTAQLVARWYLGAPKPNGVVSGGAHVILLSRKVLDFMSEQQFTGWVTYPVTLYDKNGEECKGYAGLSIIGRCGPIDRSRGELLRDFPVLPNFPRYRGIYFDESSWDGADFFCPKDDTAYKFVTVRVQQAFARMGIEGLQFTRATEATWMGSLADDK